MSITKASLIDLNGQELILDADADTSITADTDDQIDIKIAGSDSLRIKANEIENVSGAFTLDVVGNITLDSDNGKIEFKDDGTLAMEIEKAASDVRFYSAISDNDIKFLGNDGGSTVTALTLDMSEAGAATFNNNVTANRVIVTDGIQDTGQGGSETVFNESGSTADFRIESDSSTHMLFVDGGNNAALFGKSSPDFSATAGTELRSDGRIFGGIASSAVMFLNRITDDGDIVELRKDGSAVGVIQTKSSQLSIGTGDTGIQTNQDVNAIIPHNTSTNANIDNSIDLGYAAGGSNFRFKDLKLSGGIYLGGTGSANYLDDYEEGTWTASVNGASGNNTTGYYVKVGNKVNIQYYTGAATLTNVQASISGLPFTTSNDVQCFGNFFTVHNTSVTDSPGGYFSRNATTGYFTGNNSASVPNYVAGSTKYFMINGSYFTD